MRRLLGELLLLSSCVRLSAAQTPLSQNNIAQTQKGNWVIEFYAPWCAHCKKLSPHYKKLHIHFAERNANKPAQKQVHIAAVDGTQNKDLVQKFDVKGYPTIFLLRDGRKIATFHGARNFDGLLNFVQENIDPTEEDSAYNRPLVTQTWIQTSFQDMWRLFLDWLSDLPERLEKVEVRYVMLATMIALSTCSAGLLSFLFLATTGRARAGQT